MKLVKAMLLTAMLLLCVTGSNKAGVGKVKPVETQNEFTGKITDVTVFKDGHALFLAQGVATPQDGWCYSYDVPASVLGALWGFAAHKDVKVDTVKSGFEQKPIQRPCLSFAEMIKANAGKQAAIIDKNKETHQGIIIGIPHYSSEQEKQEVINLPNRYDMWGRYIGGQQIRKTKPEQVKQSAPFVILESDEGVELIALEDIKGIRFKEKDTVTSLAEEQKKRRISMHLTGKGALSKREVKVGMVYLQRGLRWIPDYRIELLDDKQARITLQATIINEVADLEKVSLRLVVGVPSFLMKDQLSPLALRECSLQLGSYFAAPTDAGASGAISYLHNSMMSQDSAPGPGPQGISAAMPTEVEGQQEDLYIYHQPEITLKKGERMLIQLLETTVSYEDIYTWDIPALPPRELWRYGNHQQLEQMLRSLTGAEVVHKLRLKNTGEQPWTTGPATIFKDSAPLAQQLLTYTSVNNTVDVAVTTATDLNTRKEETEDRRENNVNIAGNDYIQAFIKGKLTVHNYKDRTVRLIVKRKALGIITQASHDGVIRQVSVAEEAVPNSWQYRWWYWGSWPWWLRINSFSEVSWELELAAGDTVNLEYEYNYYYRH